MAVVAGASVNGGDPPALPGRHPEFDSIVDTERPAEALTPLNVGVRAYRRWRLLQELVVEALGGDVTALGLLGRAQPYGARRVQRGCQVVKQRPRIIGGKHNAPIILADKA